ncbi:hypothetical protein GE09DRAFT_383831 [Coniochaeta sp. 2T2.1]|nr:hypothetical protein GE09DRAFT_383831 [Coniochaeta sp. 2T2.1]
MSRITGPLHLLSNKLQDDEKELVMGYRVEVVPWRLAPEVVPGQRLPGGLSDIRHRDLPPTPPEPRIFGLRRVTFALVIALIVVTIAGAVAAGVEASTAAQCRANSKTIISAPEQQGNSTLAIKTVTMTMAVPGSTPTAATVSLAPDNALKR